MHRGSSLSRSLLLMSQSTYNFTHYLSFITEEYYAFLPSGMNLKDFFIEEDIRQCIAIFIKSLITIGNKAPGILEMKLMYQLERDHKISSWSCFNNPWFLEYYQPSFYFVPLLISVTERRLPSSLQQQLFHTTSKDPIFMSILAENKTSPHIFIFYSLPLFH